MASITLRIMDGADRGRVYEDLPTPVTIGREEGNTVQLNDERVSRFHLKIQEDQGKIVLTDLDSTNGTRVNGEVAQLRILRYGDTINVGRTSMLFGSQDQVARRLAELRAMSSESLGTVPDSKAVLAPIEPNLEFEFNENGQGEPHAILHALAEPDLPERLSPCQAAQLSELLEYVLVRQRHLIETVSCDEDEERVTLEMRQWQNLIDLQAKLACFLRTIGHPHSDE